MIEKFRIVSVLVLAVWIAGCGSGSTDVDDTDKEATLPSTQVASPTDNGDLTDTATSASSVETGIGYYIDAPVEGLKFICGSQNGLTNKEGMFTFEVGKSCTFYVGSVKLREVIATDLKDGEKIYEDNVTRAQVLQSLDSDNNPDNGITIDPDRVRVIEDADIATITQDNLATIKGVLTQSGYQVVDEANASAHLIKQRLLGKTLYAHYRYPDFLSVAFNDQGGAYTYTIHGLATDQNITRTINFSGKTATFTSNDIDVVWSFYRINDTQVLLYETYDLSDQNETNVYEKYRGYLKELYFNRSDIDSHHADTPKDPQQYHAALVGTWLDQACENFRRSDGSFISMNATVEFFKNGTLQETFYTYEGKYCVGKVLTTEKYNPAKFTVTDQTKVINEKTFTLVEISDDKYPGEITSTYVLFMRSNKIYTEGTCGFIDTFCSANGYIRIDKP